MKPIVARIVAFIGTITLSLTLIYFTAAALTKDEKRLVVTVERIQPTVLEKINARELARQLLTAKSYKCLTKLIGKESAWDPKAKNPHSSARGIGQLLSSTYTNLGMKHSKNENAQLIATLAYIGRRYGNGGPCAAWDFHRRHNYF